MQAETPDGGDEDETLEQLLKGLGAEGGDKDPEDYLHGVLETMMSQLMSKEVLYEPLKELNDKVRLQSCHPC